MSFAPVLAVSLPFQSSGTENLDHVGPQWVLGAHRQCHPLSSLSGDDIGLNKCYQILIGLLTTVRG